MTTIRRELNIRSFNDLYTVTFYTVECDQEHCFVIDNGAMFPDGFPSEEAMEDAYVLPRSILSEALKCAKRVASNPDHQIRINQDGYHVAIKGGVDEYVRIFFYNNQNMDKNPYCDYEMLIKAADARRLYHSFSTTFDECM